MDLEKDIQYLMVGQLEYNPDATTILQITNFFPGIHRYQPPQGDKASAHGVG